MTTPQKNDNSAAKKDLVKPNQLQPAEIANPKHALHDDDDGPHQDGPLKKKTKITIAPPPSKHLLYMRKNYERFVLTDNFEGRLDYWSNYRGKKKGARDCHRIQRNRDGKLRSLDWEDCHVAILSVTQAILDPNNTPTYGIISSMLMSPARLPDDVVGDTLLEVRIAPAQRPLIMAWLIGAKDRGETLEPILEEHYGDDYEAYRKALKNREKKKKELEVTTQQQEDSAAGQHIVCVVAEIIHTPLYSHGVPSIRVFDSTRALLWDPGEGEIDNLLTNMRWYYGDTDVQSLPEPVITHWPEVSTQNYNYNGMQTCGVHTILNGWAVAIGMSQHINSSKPPTHQDYKDAIIFIGLVYQGCADFWLLYSFLSEKDFIRPPCPLVELKALEGENLVDYKIDTFINTLAAVGAQFFDRTVGIPYGWGKW